MNHPDRVRRHYACAYCGGDGENLEGGVCHMCNGAGVVLHALPPVKKITLTPAQIDGMKSDLRRFADSLEFVHLIHRQYGDDFNR